MVRAGDVIGVGLDVSNMCVFWTRGGLYMGVLADQETLLGLLRTALGSGETTRPAWLVGERGYTQSECCCVLTWW